MQQHPARRGMALIAALALMTVLGLLIVGAVGSVVVAQRSAELARIDATLDAAADYAIGTVLADPRGYGLADLALGRARSYSIPLVDAGRAAVSATRLPGGILWLVAALGAGSPDSGRRTMSLVARFPSLGFIPPAAIVARGGVVTTNAVAFSVDTATDPDCGNRSPPAEVVVAPGSSASLGAGQRVATSSAAGDSASYLLTVAQLAALDSGVPGAVVHVRGDTTIASGAFDGVLIVDGSVAVTGAFALSGLLVARDSVTASSGLTVRGAMMAFGSSQVAMRLASGVIEYSPCQIARALRRAARPLPVRGRAWGELF
ncbi:MAG TPA: hypothetical protein VN651_17580 [Gemmatimonadaceae bacterium]|nr:hypothetical protein [Gemmatimonadaceae bacterium]